LERASEGVQGNQKIRRYYIRAFAAVNKTALLNIEIKAIREIAADALVIERSEGEKSLSYSLEGT
jgi:hypothetical protein